MTQEYLVSLVNGIKFKTNDVNLTNLEVLMNKNDVFAVELGGKSVLKRLISFIAKSECAVSADKNIVIDLVNDSFYLNVTDQSKAIIDLTEALNKKAHVLFNGDILFYREIFHHAEPQVPENSIVGG